MNEQETEIVKIGQKSRTIATTIAQSGLYPCSPEGTMIAQAVAMGTVAAMKAMEKE